MKFGSPLLRATYLGTTSRDEHPTRHMCQLPGDRTQPLRRPLSCIEIDPSEITSMTSDETPADVKHPIRCQSLNPRSGPCVRSMSSFCDAGRCDGGGGPSLYRLEPAPPAPGAERAALLPGVQERPSAAARWTRGRSGTGITGGRWRCSGTTTPTTAAW